MFYYSKSTRGFYLREIHGDNIPTDVVEVTPEQHKELMEGQPKGGEIHPNEFGFPVLVFKNQPTKE